MAYGLHNLHQDVCGAGAVGVCPELFPFNGSLFKVRGASIRRTIGMQLKWDANKRFGSEMFDKCYNSKHLEAWISF